MLRVFPRQEDAAGIGVALTRRIVDLHGGSARIEDREGGGARFVLAIGAGAECVEQGE